MTMSLWRFETARFRVELLAEYDCDPDLSWRDEAQIKYDLKHGVEYWCFSVAVSFDGQEIAWETLCNSGYSDPHDFATEHRDPDPMNRNCSIMRKAKGDNVIGHYFPDMVATAIREARAELAKAAPRLRRIA